MNQFVCSSLGLSSINPPSSNFGDLLPFTRANQPIFLILGASADPSQELHDLAEKSRVEFNLLAMGNSQQIAATDLLKKCMESGSWLCLSNLHLVPEFLLKIHGVLSTQEPKSTFRLWLTSEPDDSIPAVPLQQSLKVAFETPPGVRQNLQRTLTQWIELEQNNVQTSEYLQRAYFVLAWFNALVQERRTYIPQGWLKFYEFNANDLRVARQTLENQTQGQGNFFKSIRLTTKFLYENKSKIIVGRKQ
jgi:dynein heavy chain 2